MEEEEKLMDDEPSEMERLNVRIVTSILELVKAMLVSCKTRIER